MRCGAVVTPLAALKTHVDLSALQRHFLVVVALGGEGAPPTPLTGSPSGKMTNSPDLLISICSQIVQLSTLDRYVRLRYHNVQPVFLQCGSLLRMGIALGPVSVACLSSRCGMEWSGVW